MNRQRKIAASIYRNGGKNRTFVYLVQKMYKKYTNYMNKEGLDAIEIEK